MPVLCDTEHSMTDTVQACAARADLAPFHIIEALNEADDSGLAAARLTDKGQAVAGLHLKAELGEDRHLRAGRVPEAHIAQLHTAPSLLSLCPCTPIIAINRASWSV